MGSIWDKYSAAADTLTFLRHFVRKQVFQDLATLISFQKRWDRFGVPRDRAALRSLGWLIEYGLAIMRFRLSRPLTAIHPMPPVIGHTGSAGCWLFYHPPSDVLFSGRRNVVSTLTNVGLPAPLRPKSSKISPSLTYSDSASTAANSPKVALVCPLLVFP
jgi:hypothetical protein